MNAPSEFSMKTDDVLRFELEVFRREHRDLDEAIVALTEKSTADQLTLQRLKKEKTCSERSNCIDRRQIDA